MLLAQFINLKHSLFVKRKRMQKINHHPIFDKEDTREISLLDGIDSSRIQEDNVEIEEKKKKPEKMSILGVDDEDL